MKLNPDYYRSSWITPKTRESVMKRAEGKCYRCGNYNEGQWKMAIHHLDFDSFNNQEGNLIYLCRPCHTIIHRATFRPRGWDKYNYNKQHQPKGGSNA
jgi:5-methylcytosine-specific restriction endonuclease McrA